jgi:O-antigen ligase
LITSRDVAVQAVAAPHRPPPQDFFVPTYPSMAVPFRERLLLFVLYVTVFASSVAFIEPSPHDALMGLLALACLIAGVRLDRRLALLIILLLAFNLGGLLSLLNVPGKQESIQYGATSVYLAVAAIVFACLSSENTMQRMATLRSAYVATAVLVSLAGIAGYFHAFPGAHAMFAPGDRALGAFKDPNVFGPYLIWPALVVLERMFLRRFSALDIGVAGILLLALLVSFSRGAWIHFAVSCAVMLTLAFLTAPTPAVRLRIFGLSILGLVGLAAFVAIALSFESVATMFKERFQLVQSYDVGEGGRFGLQELALAALLQYPNGMGPFEFARVYGLQQHNVYLQAFMVYGWIGGVSYIMLLIATFIFALRSVFAIDTPWRPYLIATVGALAGEVLEGIVIDTDHWRHFFLLLGLTWGLSVATSRCLRQRTAGGFAHVRAA